MSKVWLITGASSGFGRAFAEAALAAGDTVVATARRTEALDDLVAAYPDRVTAAALDVTDPARISDVVADTILWHGRIDVLLNNAGSGLVGAVEETTEKQLRDQLEVMFFGAAALTRAVVPHMRRAGSGAIVQLSSMGGRLSFAGYSAYSAAKFALEGFSEALAAEVEPFGVKVLLVEPGAFRTNLFGGNFQAAEEMPEYSETVGVTRSVGREFGNAPGDPAKAAAAVIDAIEAERTPLRLILGADALEAIVAHDERLREEQIAWEKVTRGTDFD